MSLPTPTTTAPTAQHRGRHWPTWAVVLVVAGAGCIVLVALVVALVAAGIIGAGEAAQHQGAAARASAAALDKRDPAAGDACRYLDMELGGVATWDDVASHAAAATTYAIRTATTERTLYDACTGAGAHMSPWPAGR